MTYSIEGFALWLATEGRPKSQGTIRVYTRSARQLRSWLLTHGVTSWDKAKRHHIRAFIAETRDRSSDGYAATVFWGCKAFFRYMVAEEWETGISPMASMTAPDPGRPLIPVLTRDQLVTLITSCETARDEALIRLLADTGMRLSECAGLKVADCDLGKAARILVHGKGGKDRYVIPGKRTVLALRRYLLRERSVHPRASSEWLWLGVHGPMTDSGLYKAVRAAGNRAGLDVHPHQLRHSWAHHWRADGGSLDDLVHLAGWSGPAMALRYGASAAGERAETAARSLSLGDRL